MLGADRALLLRLDAASFDQPPIVVPVNFRPSPADNQKALPPCHLLKGNCAETQLGGGLLDGDKIGAGRHQVFPCSSITKVRGRRDASSRAKAGMHSMIAAPCQAG